jgi:hypothetical protein
MADPYPSIPQTVATQLQGSFGTQVDRAESGRPRFRTFHSQEWKVFTVRHECNKAEMLEIVDHYLAFPMESFTFVYAGDGVSYTVRWANHPVTQVLDGDWLWSVESPLIVV